jgi:hypothetical protein
MRNEAMSTLIKWVEENKPQLKSIGVLGGSAKEPELVELLRIYPDSAVTYLGIEKGVNENPFIDLDLNEFVRVNQSFDIVICAQVLEHVWNLENCMKNLFEITSPRGGLLWLNCPASNMVHGSPEYFSAGYSSEMVIRNLENHKFEVILADSIGTRRLYFFTHTLQYWPTKFELAHPLLTYRPLRSYGRRVFIETFLGFFGRLYSLFLSNRKISKSQYDTETYVLAKLESSSSA